MNLQGKSVLITGASGGIGASLARSLHRRGAKLTLMARSAETLEKAAAETQGVAVTGDVTNAEDRKRAVDAALERWGSLDVLVNNAGVGMYIPAWRADMGEVRRLWELNIFAPLELIQLVVPVMQKQGGGRIVNVSSVAGKIALPWFPNYTASKFALCALTDALRIELAPYNISTMDVCPGYVKTAFQDNSLAGRPPDRLWRMKRMAVMPDECAEAIARGMERDKRTLVMPWFGNVLIAAARLAPSIADRILAHIYEGLDLEGIQQR
ncbi:MAG: SDR family NAD(P)-dependent oxidoreductase [Bryobacteraceae bacterium]